MAESLSILEQLPSLIDSTNKEAKMDNKSSIAEQLEKLPSQISSTRPDKIENLASYTATVEFWACVMLFGLAVLVFILMSNRLKDSNRETEPSEILKIFGIPFIVISAVFVVVLVPKQDAITPIIGLMGTIAGYLLGKAEKLEEQSSATNTHVQDQKNKPTETDIHAQEDKPIQQSKRLNGIINDK